MSIFTKISIGVKLLFGKWESAMDTAIAALNAFLVRPDIAKHVAKVRDTVDYILNLCEDYGDYCPAKWQKDFAALVSALNTFSNALADGELSPEEIRECASACKAAIDYWMKD